MAEDLKMTARSVLEERTIRSTGLVGGLDEELMRKVFERNGYSMQVQGKLHGISGGIHQFNFVCTKFDGSERIIVESLIPLSSSMEALEVALVKLRLKTFDCCPEVNIVVTSHLPEPIKQMARFYKLTLVEIVDGGRSPYEQIESLLKLKADY